MPGSWSGCSDAVSGSRIVLIIHNKRQRLF